MKILKYLLLSVIILDLLALAVAGFFAYKVYTPLNNFSEEAKVVNIDAGTGLDEIAFQLKEEGILTETPFFILYAIMERKEGDLKAGEHIFTPNMSIKDIVNRLAGSASLNTKKITFPEGFTSAQMADRLVENSIIKNKEEFLNFSKLSSVSAYNIFDHDFLSEINAASLEGFLFPDTYELVPDSGAAQVISKMLDAFDDKAWSMLQEGGEKEAASYDSYELLIIASLLEEEVQTEEDMKQVAGILYNRLEIGMPLQVDATLAFITGKQTGQLTNADKEIDSPYNTYQNRGLPPAPISNPGLKAIGSALDPAQNDYLYYLTGKDGNTYFGRTLEEHNENKRLYLR